MLVYVSDPNKFELFPCYDKLCDYSINGEVFGITYDDMFVIVKPRGRVKKRFIDDYFNVFRVDNEFQCCDKNVIVLEQIEKHTEHPIHNIEVKGDRIITYDFIGVIGELSVIEFLEEFSSNITNIEDDGKSIIVYLSVNGSDFVIGLNKFIVFLNVINDSNLFDWRTISIIHKGILKRFDKGLGVINLSFNSVVHSIFHNPYYSELLKTVKLNVDEFPKSFCDIVDGVLTFTYNEYEVMVNDKIFRSFITNIFVNELSDYILTYIINDYNYNDNSLISFVKQTLGINDKIKWRIKINKLVFNDYYESVKRLIMNIVSNCMN